MAQHRQGFCCSSDITAVLASWQWHNSSVSELSSVFCLGVHVIILQVPVGGSQTVVLLASTAPHLSRTCRGAGHLGVEGRGKEAGAHFKRDCSWVPDAQAFSCLTCTKASRGGAHTTMRFSIFPRTFSLHSFLGSPSKNFIDQGAAGCSAYSSSIWDGGSIVSWCLSQGGGGGALEYEWPRA